MFFQLKGFDEGKTIDEIDRMLDVLDLQDKRHAQARTLSGGMKRKLSVGIAFSAGSKVHPLHTQSIKYYIFGYNVQCII